MVLAGHVRRMSKIFKQKENCFRLNSFAILFERDSAMNAAANSLLATEPETKTETYLLENEVYVGDCRFLLDKLAPESVAVSFWSPPYHVGKEYEAGVEFDHWTELLSEVVQKH